MVDGGLVVVGRGSPEGEEGFVSFGLQFSQMRPVPPCPTLFSVPLLPLVSLGRGGRRRPHAAVGGGCCCCCCRLLPVDRGDEELRVRVRVREQDWVLLLEAAPQAAHPLLGGEVVWRPQQVGVAHDGARARGRVRLNGDVAQVAGLLAKKVLSFPTPTISTHRPAINWAKHLAWEARDVRSFYAASA